MTIDDLIRAAGQHSWMILALFAAPPVLTFATGRLHDNRLTGARFPYKWVYGGLIYLVSFPGMLAAVLTGYGMFFLRADLRQVPILLYFLPILSMAATWLIMRAQVDLDDVPGFERLSALMISIGLCFTLAFVLNRLFFGILFFGSLWSLLVMAIVFFAVFRLTLRRIAS